MFIKKFLLGLSLIFSLAVQAKLKIITSIAPFYNISAALIQGSPDSLELIVPTKYSVHDYQLKPSDLNKIKRADLIIWSGPDLEHFLPKALKHAHGAIIELSTSQIKKLKLRSGYNWESSCACHQHEGKIDQHIWLSLDNALIIAQNIYQTLAKLQPTQKTIYAHNYQQFKQKILALKLNLKQDFAKIKHKNFLVFHDAYQYLEQEFHLNAKGAITLHPELGISAQRLKKIKSLIQKENIECIFAEPQFSAKIVKSLSPNLKFGILDPLGQKADLGPNGYFSLIKQLKLKLLSCFNELQKN